MDIHPPLGPLMSWKEVLLPLGIVTIGILIALSLEGLVEWNHHRHLVREARENIRVEIEDNQKELAGHLKQVERVRSEHQTILHLDRRLAEIAQELDQITCRVLQSSRAGKYKLVYRAGYGCVVSDDL